MSKEASQRTVHTPSPARPLRDRRAAPPPPGCPGLLSWFRRSESFAGRARATCRVWGWIHGLSVKQTGMLDCQPPGRISIGDSKVMAKLPHPVLRCPEAATKQPGYLTVRRIADKQAEQPYFPSGRLDMRSGLARRIEGSTVTHGDDDLSDQSLVNMGLLQGYTVCDHTV